MDFVGELASDRDRLLADLAKTEARLAEARAQLDAGGLTAIGSRGQPRPSPLVAIESGLVRDAARLRRELHALRVSLRVEEDRRRVEQQVAEANALLRGAPMPARG